MKSDVVLTTQRQEELLESTYNHIKEAIKALHDGFPSDIVAIDMKKAIEQLDSIIGRNFTEDLIDTMFSTFCVGK